MQPEVPTPSDPLGDGKLPPVTPPSAGFILQLFLVPGILVALVVAFIWFFFGWIGGGPDTPEEFMKGLRNEGRLISGVEIRWITAERLAQVLQRDEKLASNVPFALDVTGLLEQEMHKPPPVVSPAEPDKETDADVARFMALAVGRFSAPVGMPVFQEMLRRNQNVDDVGQRLRLRAVIWAITLLGEKMKKYDSLPQEQKDAIVADLKKEGGQAPGGQTWARKALDYLNYREERKNTPEPLPDPFDMAGALRPCAESADGLTRELTAYALAHWDGPGTEALLVQLTAANEGVRYFEKQNETHGRRIIRYNAAASLAQRGKPDFAEPIILEMLNESTQRKLYADNEGQAIHNVWTALKAVKEMRKVNPEAFNGPIRTSVESLAENSPTVRLQVEAKKLLGRSGETVGLVRPSSRQILLIVGVGGGVLTLLALAVIARWRRRTSAPEVLS